MTPPSYIRFYGQNIWKAPTDIHKTNDKYCPTGYNASLYHWTRYIDNIESYPTSSDKFDMTLTPDRLTERSLMTIYSSGSDSYFNDYINAPELLIGASGSVPSITFGDINTGHYIYTLEEAIEQGLIKRLYGHTDIIYGFVLDNQCITYPDAVSGDTMPEGYFSASIDLLDNISYNVEGNIASWTMGDSSLAADWSCYTWAEDNNGIINGKRYGRSGIGNGSYGDSWPQSIYVRLMWTCNKEYDGYHLYTWTSTPLNGLSTPSSYIPSSSAQMLQEFKLNNLYEAYEIMSCFDINEARQCTIKSYEKFMGSEWT